MITAFRFLRWHWILIVTVGGVVFGLISVTGLLHPNENLILFVLLVFVGAIAVAQRLNNPCLHAFAGAGVASLAGGLIQLGMWDVYSKNNPGVAETIGATGLTLFEYFAIASPVGMVICGGIAALSAYCGTRLRR